MITLCHNNSTAITTLSRPNHLRKGGLDKLNIHPSGFDGIMPKTLAAVIST